ncbi:hypothetical protein EUGRSUZ_I00315 [Eucalyptus grandis]|uniref:Uncharacterized protein n=2 Tax=Eucalyptus grandis TaxID=71139 RepID=A0ACC3JCN4_EUCGR|nr:hypothetical protein EUGRSUZ_I00315 [Eucalyptus grandis]
MTNWSPYKSGTRQGRNGFTASEPHFTEVQIAVSLYTMSTSVKPLNHLATGARSSLNRQIQHPEAFPFVLLGNKIDIDGGHSRVVSEKRAKEWCASRGNIPYFETSAKEDYNVDEAFFCVAQAALASEHQQDIYFQGISETVSEVEPRGGCAC